MFLCLHQAHVVIEVVVVVVVVDLQKLKESEDIRVYMGWAWMVLFGVMSKLPY